jgi:uncharacterized surface protein with fasciclin (FAS1) repeats
VEGDSEALGSQLRALTEALRSKFKQRSKDMSRNGRMMAMFAVSGCLWLGGWNLSAGTAAGKSDIVDTAVKAGSFNTLVQAVKAAGLVETLKGDGPFTVFAPNDEAFAKLPAGTVEALLKDKEKLTAVLTYHVVAGRVSSGQVTKLSSAKTVQGGDLRISTEGGVRINDAKVIQADLETSNGVIHVIDTVLIP